METKNVEKLQIVTNIFLILFCIFSMFVMLLAEIRHNSNVTPTTGTTAVASTATETPTANNTQTGTPAANNAQTGTATTDKNEVIKSAEKSTDKSVEKQVEKPADTSTAQK
ncbi:hypothetical protein [Candidatus Phytoplasma sp. AldY-WA1]|uniref:hypothetical protein n=1 Tax=Candidatus Phytoplasma sp. AldY-WA1 TaxID=2852100 RepID=UPI0025513072|nr:hypothetical protein [Candidatus Phytoplasma sp. AldY-WA1]